MKRKNSMRNPRNQPLYRSDFLTIYGDIKSSEKKIGVNCGNEDACDRRKRVRFGEGVDCSLESDSDVRGKLNADSEADAPKTSEYAFFRKLRQDVEKTGLPVYKESNKMDESQAGDCSDNAGVGNIVRQSFQNLKSLLHAEDVTVRPTESSSHRSPIASPSKATGMKSPEQLDFRKSEISHPMKNAVHVNFEISTSPFRDPVRSAVAIYEYGQGNIFSTKRDKLLKLVANTYPESKGLNRNGVDLVNLMMCRLFPKGYDSKHDHRPPKCRQQDFCISTPPGFPGNKDDSEEFHRSANRGSRKSVDLMQLDNSCKTLGSTKLSKWGVDYSISPDWGSELIPKMKEPYHNFDYGRRRSPLKKYLNACLPDETFKSHTSSDLHSHHPNNLPSRENLLLGWVDEKTEDDDYLQIAPYKFDYGRSLHSNCPSLWNNDHPFVSSFPPQFLTGHYGGINSYVYALEDADDCVASGSGHLLEDKECMQDSRLSTPEPDSIPRKELVPSNYFKGQLMCIDQPWEFCGMEVTCASYKSHDCNSDGAYQICYTDKPSTSNTIYHRLPYTSESDEANVIGRSIDDDPASDHKCDMDMIFITSKIPCIQSPPAFYDDSFMF